ncbi:MAG TPA: magnesium transporter CorA family protein [Dehalococcoidia bacterium]|nr:magnesium transporter CorA family protein [Dehalococcoidia bacterium]
MARLINRRRRTKGRDRTEGAELPEEPLHVEEITWGDLTWVNIQSPTERDTEYLAEKYDFHPLALDDCLSRKQLPKLDIYPGYLFFVFHFPFYDKETRISSKRQWSAFVGENLLVTLHTGELKTLTALFKDCQANEDAREEYMNSGSGFLLYSILDRAIDSYFPVLDKLMELAENVEDSVFDEYIEATKELSIIRRDIITQRAVMFPTRAIFIEMENKIKRFTDVDVTAYYNDLMDHINKICETLDEVQEIIEVYKDADYTLATYRLNRVTRLLTIFSTIILPFLLVSSLFGMNVVLPGGIEAGNPVTFVILLVIMLVIAGGMLIFFRHRRWI